MSFESLLDKAYTAGVGAAIVAGVLLAMNLLAKTGRMLRTGIETKRQLRDGWNFGVGRPVANRKANLLIGAPIFFWSAFYALDFCLLPMSYAMHGLWFLLCPVVGYFGYKFSKGE